MRESQRLAFLQAIGVISWVPRQPLAHAAVRMPAEAEPSVQHASTVDVTPAPVDDAPADSTAIAPADTVKPVAGSPSARLVEQRRAQVAAQPARKELPPQAVLAPEQAATRSALEPVGRTVAPFYLQLWMAGPCALLIEISDPGLEKGTAEHNLLCDILRAAGLPPAPRLQADFRWPLSRNPQVARSAEAASEALQTFMQARLELQPVKSIGCFGAMAGLLATGDPEEAAALKGREEAIEELGAGWFAPGIEVMLQQPREKAGLWQLLKRVMPRWTETR